MWRKQIRAERAAEAASQMVAKANALQKAAMERPGSSGNEGGLSEDVSENETDNPTLVQSHELPPVSISDSTHDLASPLAIPKPLIRWTTSGQMRKISTNSPALRMALENLGQMLRSHLHADGSRHT